MTQGVLFIALALAIVILAVINTLLKHRQQMLQLRHLSDNARQWNNLLMSSLAALAMQKTLVLYKDPRTNEMKLSVLNTHSSDEVKDYLDRIVKQMEERAGKETNNDIH